MIEKKIIYAHALENALSHGGKANQKAVLNALFAEGLKKEDIKKTIPEIQKILKQVNSLPPLKQEKEFEKLKSKVKKRKTRKGLPNLPNVQEKIVMRFAPFPSGPLHIGNARQLILNDEYSKTYNGKLILVIDDTIGSKEKPIELDAYKLIPKSLDWLNVKYDKKIVYKSERLKIYYSYAKELIKKGYMYVCDCPQEEFKELRKIGKECGCRNLPVEEHEKRWGKMLSKEAKEGVVVRLKTSMQHSNPAFRDRVMFRISNRPHPKVSTKLKVWPLLEFSWAIDDHLLGMTHIIRGVDLLMETQVEKFIWKIFSWPEPEILHTGLFSIKGIKLSTSKGAKEVRSGEYIGWNDPRTWSIQSLRDRGIQKQAIREFVLNMGLTKNNSTIAIDVLYALNKKLLQKALRYFFVEEPVKILIKGSPELNAKLPKHPSENLGSRQYKTSQEFLISKKDFELIDNRNYRLMHLLNFKSQKLSTIDQREFRFISEEPQPDLNVKFLHWLPSNSENVKVKIRMPDNSLIKGLGEPKLKNLKKGAVIQFERFGFVSLYKKSKDELEFWFAHR